MSSATSTAPSLPNRSSAKTTGFGTFTGVFTPSILTILGVIMYLRLGWVVGNAGLLQALLIVIVAHTITAATGLSVSSIATNRTVGAGGAYNIISRSLGAPAGAAIGLPLYFSQALSVTFYVVGFAESLGYLFEGIPIKLTSTITLILLAFLSFKSAALALKAQYFVMAAIIASLVAVFAGSPVVEDMSVGWVAPDDAPAFATIFAVFFPAVTGIMAGVSMSGDLKDPRRSLPFGTMLAIGTGFIVYIIFVIFFAWMAPLDVLRQDNRVLFSIAAVPALIYAGVWGATLSSGLGSILGAPRTLQALALDGMVPRFLGKGSGPSNEPRVGTLVTYGLAQAGILLGDLDAIAPVLTMFFLATYAVTNLACGLERWAASPSFRPDFRVPAWVSLFGFVGCVYVMSIIHLPAMIGALLCCAGIYLYVQRNVLNTTFGDARHGIIAAIAQTALHQLRRVDYHAMNWRPNLVIAGGSDKRHYLLELGSTIVQERGMVTYFHLLRGEVSELADERLELLQTLEGEHGDDFPNVFFRVDIVPRIYPGVVTVSQSYGVGNFEANTVMVGWTAREDRREGYIQMLRDLVRLERSVMIVRRHPTRKFGAHNRIQIWWGGLKGNGGLMLLLAFLLTNHPRWRGATVEVITVVESEGAKAKADVAIRRVLQNARLEAEPNIIVRDGRSLPEIMREVSPRADLAIIGIRVPEDDDGVDPFFDRMSAMLEEMPTTIMVRSAKTFVGTPVLFDQDE
ncbi:MAG: Na-K-Cl cotransporter [Myxococcota bacterium]